MKAAPADLANGLIEARRTLVLATADPGPWSAPVYYVYRKGRFYFFSSPRSRHVVAAMASGRCAGSIFRDGDDWREIEGLQMEGRLERVRAGTEAARALGDYVKKFPTVRDFFAEETFDFGRFTEHFRTRLYAFVPERVFYLNNRAGIGKRGEIRLPWH